MSNRMRIAAHCGKPIVRGSRKKLRLVLDLRHVNLHIQIAEFRYEDLRSLPEIFEQGFYFFTFDLESGYHHIEIF